MPVEHKLNKNKLNLVKQILFMYLKIPLVSRQCIQYYTRKYTLSFSILSWNWNTQKTLSKSIGNIVCCVSLAPCVYIYAIYFRIIYLHTLCMVNLQKSDDFPSFRIYFFSFSFSVLLSIITQPILSIYIPTTRNTHSNTNNIFVYYTSTYANVICAYTYLSI